VIRTGTAAVFCEQHVLLSNLTLSSHRYHNINRGPPIPSLTPEPDGARTLAIEAADRLTSRAQAQLNSEGFAETLRKIDGNPSRENTPSGSADPQDVFAEPPRFLQPVMIPIPEVTPGELMDQATTHTLLMNIAHAVNLSNLNMAVIARRQEYAIAQNIVTSVVNDDALRGVSYELHEMQTDLDNLSASVNDTNALRTPLNPATVPVFSGREELQKLSANVASLAAQMGTVQGSMSLLEKQLIDVVRPKTSNAAGNPPVPHSRPLPVSNQPNRPTTNTRPEANLTPGHKWFTEAANTLHENNILWWARILSMGRWGPLKQDGKPSHFGGRPASSTQLQDFIHACINRAFSPGSYARLPLPPSTMVGVTLEDTVKTYNWIVWNGLGKPPTQPPNSPVTVKYSPGFEPKSAANRTPSNFEIPNTDPNQRTPVNVYLPEDQLPPP
jgi:tetrahydromethanopterin S-methyltransferase subunit B